MIWLDKNVAKIKLMIENAYTIGKTNHIVETRNIESVAKAAIITLIKEAISISVKLCPEAKSSNKGKVLTACRIIAASAVRKNGVFLRLNFPSDEFIKNGEISNRLRI